MSPFILIPALIGYLAFLFWLARFADKQPPSHTNWTRHPLVYSLALGVYCTSWTFYGLVSTAASSGWSFLPILLGPVLLFTLGFPLLQRIASICHKENIHSIADFIAFRYGKRQSIAAIVTLIVLTATVPYIALQIKAVSDIIIYCVDDAALVGQHMALLVATIMILFSLIFGSKRLDVAQYHAGVMVAIAFESFVKIIAMVAIAIFSLSLTDETTLSQVADSTKNNNAAFYSSPITLSFVVLTAVSAATIFCLPRMFHVTFVECPGKKHLLFARRNFTAYLLIIAAAIFCIAWVGNNSLGGNSALQGSYMLALPLMNNNLPLSLLAFIGGVSAATAMIIVASMTLSQMLSNDVVLPLLLRKQKMRNPIPDYSKSLILSRRLTIIAVIFCAWVYQKSLAENVALTEIGVIAFALVVQLAPAIILGLYWQKGNAAGMIAGLVCGTFFWFMCLVLPLLIEAGFFTRSILEQGLFNLAILKPHELLGLTYSDTYTRGVLMSIGSNIITYILVSRLDVTRLSDRIQALTFIKNSRASSGSDLSDLHVNKKDLYTVLSQFLGESTTQRIFESSALDNQTTSDNNAHVILLDYAEKALTGTVGVASARAILKNLSDGQSLGVEQFVNIFEETTRSLQFNQDMLFASFESISSAISVVNADLKMVAWNKRYEQLFNYPSGMLCVGRLAGELIRFNAERGLLGPGNIEELVQTRLNHLLAAKPYRVVRNQLERIIEIKVAHCPMGGYVTTYDDISEFIHAQKALEKANELLEIRVKERTKEVEKINTSLRLEVDMHAKTEEELRKAKVMAESSNAHKTQFLAIASHDILQPLNAANLYANALIEKEEIDPELKESLHHLRSAIGSAEIIISNLLEISKLDSGALKSQPTPFSLNETLESLANQFKVQVSESVEFHWVSTSLWTMSDPKYFRRILQNFLSNATKYTVTGKILLGCRRHKSNIYISVYDTGPGISEAHQKRIFDDFYRVASQIEGAGLGLSIASRFANLLGHKIELSSTPGKGSCFSLCVPLEQPNKEFLVKNAPAEIHSELAGTNIFYIDDAQKNIHALGMLVENWGCNFLSVDSVQNAKTFMQQNSKPHVLLIDYQLGEGIDGIELGLLLREQWGAIPTCLVSAEQDKDLPERARQHGFDFLRKPLRPNKLRALLERYSLNIKEKTDGT